MLNWCEDDLALVLEVFPEINEEQYIYVVKQNNLELHLTIYPDWGDVYIELFSNNAPDPIFNMELSDCQRILKVNNKLGECLEFAPSKCFGEGFEQSQVLPYGVRIKIRPSIQVNLYS
ncbi:Ypar14, super integron cassette [Pseudoalteromonas sp. SWXJZ94C]|uniref:Ypar14, super integron cassette n=1 Tax=Pseudoalteromonas sp. SWXJZ94C TaxID=2792065 RepID=UPI0018CD98C0|nr:Ypar14, super integron cassette [Pseudoalteromonas sp. SWXJZ94C]MBH0058916.1 Ypar14, super integron cassette [Pseudoalteromonas sp. SWXJZ94C]